MEDSPFIYVWYEGGKEFLCDAWWPQNLQGDTWFAILQACDAYVQNVLISEYIAL